MELLGLGIGRTRHARQLPIHAEVVLVRDGRQRAALGLNVDALFGLDRLVQAIAPAPPLHLATRELIDDQNLAALDEIVDVLFVEHMRPQPLVDVVQQLVVLGRV